STTGRGFSSLRQNTTARGSEPSDRLAARLVLWKPRRRVAYLAWAIVLGPIVFGVPSCRSTRPVQRRKGGRRRKGQDRREGPRRLSKKIHGRLSEKGTGLSGRRPRGQSRQRGHKRPAARTDLCGMHFKNTQAVGERPGLRVRRQMVRRGEVRRSSVPSIFTASAERRLMKLEPCLADAPCRRPGPATSKCDRNVRSPLFDLRRPV